MTEKFYDKIDKFCNETDWNKYPTYEHALEKFIEGIVSEETKELQKHHKKVCEEFTFAHRILAETIKNLEKQISDMSDLINDLVHLGTFDENTDEEYVNYQVHEALKKAEKYLPK